MVDCGASGPDASGPGGRDATTEVRFTKLAMPSCTMAPLLLCPVPAARCGGIFLVHTRSLLRIYLKFYMYHGSVHSYTTTSTAVQCMLKKTGILSLP